MQYNHDGIKSRYQLVPRTLIFIRNKDKYLFIHKKISDSFGYGKLNGIGGHIEKGEEPYESAIREIKEETGLIINVLSLAAIVFIDIRINPGILMFVYSAAYKNGSIQASAEGELVWIAKNKIKERNDFVKDVPFLLDITETHKNGSPPRFIKYLYDKDNNLRIVM